MNEDNRRSARRREQLQARVIVSATILGVVLIAGIFIALFVKAIGEPQ